MQSLDTWHVSHALCHQCAARQYPRDNWLGGRAFTCALSARRHLTPTCGCKRARNKKATYSHVSKYPSFVSTTKEIMSTISDRSQIGKRPNLCFYIIYVERFYTQQGEWIHMFTEPLPETPNTSQLAKTRRHS